jgi:nitrogen regulatory protein P-II 1
MDDQVEPLIDRLVEKLGDALGGELIVSEVPVMVDLSTDRPKEYA